MGYSKLKSNSRQLIEVIFEFWWYLLPTFPGFVTHTHLSSPATKVTVTVKPRVNIHVPNLSFDLLQLFDSLSEGQIRDMTSLVSTMRRRITATKFKAKVLQLFYPFLIQPSGFQSILISTVPDIKLAVPSVGTLERKCEWLSKIKYQWWSQHSLVKLQSLIKFSLLLIRDIIRCALLRMRHIEMPLMKFKWVKS